VKHQNVTLRRGMIAQDSQKVQTWLAQVAKQWQQASYQGVKLSITLYDAAAKPVITWTLDNAYPVAWSGPALSAADNKVAVESLEFVHHGFLAKG
jgi:phage tail-like protein